MMKSFRERLFCLLALFLLSTQCSRAMINSEEFQVSSSGPAWGLVWQFEFDGGGISTNSFSTLGQSPQNPSPETINNTLWFLLVSESQWQALAGPDVTNGKMCAKLDEGEEALKQWLPALGDNSATTIEKLNREKRSFSTDTHIASRDSYRLVFFACGTNVNFKVKADWTNVNPGGEYLSLTLVPFKSMELVLVIIWVVMFLAWFYNWVRYRAFNVKLQRFLSLVPAMEAMSSLVYLQYWRQASSTGHYDSTLWGLWLAVSCLSSGLFFLCLALVGMGWSITRAQLDRADVVRACWMCALLMAAEALYRAVNALFLFGVVIVYVVLLRFIFSVINDQHHALVTQLQLIRRLGVDATTTPVWTKHLMLKRFQGLLVCFAAVSVIFRFWSMIFLAGDPWIGVLCSRLIDVGVALVVGWTFRLRPFNPFFHPLIPADEQQGGDNNRGGLVDANSIDQSLISGGTRWRPGMPLPATTPSFSSFLDSANVPLLAVEQPGKSSYGNLQKISIAVPIEHSSKATRKSFTPRSTTSTNADESSDSQGTFAAPPPDAVSDNRESPGPVGNVGYSQLAEE